MLSVFGVHGEAVTGDKDDTSLEARVNNGPTYTATTGIVQPGVSRAAPLMMWATTGAQWCVDRCWGWLSARYSDGEGVNPEKRFRFKWVDTNETAKREAKGRESWFNDLLLLINDGI